MLPLLFLGLLAQTPEVKTDIVYRKAGEKEMKLDFYKPISLAEGPKPLVIVIHGGAWMGGKRQDMAGFAQGLAQQGFATATISYRLAPTDKWPSQIDDCQAAVRYFRSKAGEYDVDPNRFASLGASAGGHLALLLGFTDTRDKTTLDYPLLSSKVQCVVNVFGPVDLSQDFEQTMAGLVAMQVLGKSYDKATKEITEFSPITYAVKGCPPVFTLHGKADTLVPVKQAERLDKALKAAGVEHEMVLIEGMGHEVPMNRPEVSEAVTKAVNFLKKHLMPPADKL